METPAADYRQTPSREQQPVFHAGASFVNVDVYLDGQTVLVGPMSLAPLAAGDYVLEFVTTRGVRTDRSLVAFRIVR